MKDLQHSKGLRGLNGCEDGYIYSMSPTVLFDYTRGVWEELIVAALTSREGKKGVTIVITPDSYSRAPWNRILEGGE